jgi:hypothetical protein
MKIYRPISGQITRLNKLKKLKITKHVECVREMEHQCNISFTNLEGKKKDVDGMIIVKFTLKQCGLKM